MNWKTILAGLGLLAGATVLLPREDAVPVAATPASEPAQRISMPQAVDATLEARAVPTPGGTGDGSLRASAAARRLDQRSQAVLAELDQLRSLPPGEAAVALGQRIEAAATLQNVNGYIQALLDSDHPAVQRVAIAAIARVADGPTLVGLADNYGVIPAQDRGRILQVMESAQNPAAVAGLTAIVAADTTEKRSPLMMSSMYGIANTGSPDGVQYLLGQLGTSNVDYALMALERVRSPQGQQMILAAAEGSKDVTTMDAAYQPALRRIASAGVERN